MTWSSEQQQQLLVLINQRNERDRLTRLLTDAQTALTSRQAQQTALNDQLVREQTDVDQLNGLSWSNLYYTLLNRKEEQLTKGKLEAAEAQLAYADSMERVLQAEQAVADLTRQIELFSGVDAQYDALLAQKRALVHLRWDEVGRKYDELLKQVEAADRRVVETREALAAGRAVLSELYETNALLRDARQMGYMDLLNMPFASWTKLNKLDQVRERTRLLNEALYQFKSEYQDLGQSLHHDVNFDGWDRVGDIFFDNIFSDMATQSRIDRALATVEQLHETIGPIVDELAGQLEPLNDELNQRANSLRIFLEQV